MKNPVRDLLTQHGYFGPPVEPVWLPVWQWQIHIIKARHKWGNAFLNTWVYETIYRA
jgi:hypothetical protein